MIHIRNLQFSYKKQKLYRDFELSLNQTGVYGLFGRNGSGKSTLLNILSGLLFADRGLIEVLGHNPAKRTPEFLSQIYFVPEAFHLPNITLSALQKTHAPFYPNFSQTDFAEYIDAFDIPERQTFNAMSLGQKKKAVIAFALATHTPILLMDEPTNGLDIVSRSQFKTLISRTEQANRLIMISTHQAHDLESLMNHVLFVDDGKLALSASTQTLQQALSLGVSNDADLIKNCLYHEAIGQQWAYVAARQANEPLGNVNLELLYKALSFNKDGVLACINNVQTGAQNV